MIAGLGNDLVQVSRIQQALQRHPRIAQRFLTPDEWRQWQDVRDQARWLAKRFASKEAASKALGTGFRQGLSWHDMAVGHDALGKPELIWLGPLRRRAEAEGWKTWLSLSDEQDYVLATVLLEI